MNKKSEDVGSDLAPRNWASYNVRKKKKGTVRFAIRWNRFWTAPFFCDLESSGQVKNTDQFLLYVSLTAVGEEVVAFERILEIAANFLEQHRLLHPIPDGGELQLVLRVARGQEIAQYRKERILQRKLLLLSRFV